MDRRALRYTGVQLTIVGLEGIWVALATYVLSPGRPVSALVLTLTGALTLAWNRWLLARDALEGARGRLIGLAGMFLILIGGGALAEPETIARAAMTDAYAERVAILLGSKSLLVAWLAAALVIGRIVLLLRRQLTLERVVSRIRTAALISVTALALLHGEGRQLTAPVAGLVLCALLGLALARAMDLSRERGEALPFTARWVANVSLGVAVVLALGLTMALPVEPRNFAALQWLAEAAQTMLVYLFAFLLELVVNGVVPVVQWLFELYADILQRVLLPMLSALLFGREGAAEGQQIDERWLTLMAVGLVVVTITLPLFVIWHLYRLFRRGAAVAGEAEQSEEEALAAAWYEWWKARQDALHRLWALWRRRSFGVDTVRDLYKNLLLFGDDHALPRSLANTPYEYLAPLCQRYPGLVSEFHALTDAYVAAKYGEHEFSEAEVRRLQSAWQRIVLYQEEHQSGRRASPVHSAGIGG